MAVKIRLRQQGRKNHQTFRLVVVDKRCKRDGKYIEGLGWYDPNRDKDNMKIDAERTQYWLDKGAELSLDAKRLVSKGAPEVVQKLNAKIEAKKVKMAAKRRALRKAKAKKDKVAAAAKA
jgi:small subunit ribosomal protein S16